MIRLNLTTLIINLSTCSNHTAHTTHLAQPIIRAKSHGAITHIKHFAEPSFIEHTILSTCSSGTARQLISDCSPHLAHTRYPSKSQGALKIWCKCFAICATIEATIEQIPRYTKIMTANAQEHVMPSKSKTPSIHPPPTILQQHHPKNRPEPVLAALSRTQNSSGQQQLPIDSRRKFQKIPVPHPGPRLP
jgi:hypothetical protein